MPITCEALNKSEKIALRIDEFRYQHLIFKRLCLLAKVVVKHVSEEMLNLELNDMTTQSNVKAFFPLVRNILD